MLRWLQLFDQYKFASHGLWFSPTSIRFFVMATLYLPAQLLTDPATPKGVRKKLHPGHQLRHFRSDNHIIPTKQVEIAFD
jgi:hypothetical protein